MSFMFGWRNKKKIKPGRLAVCLNSSYFGFFAHAGFMLELHRLGVTPGAMSGASAGAIVAGCYAAGMDPDRMVRLLLQPDLWRRFLEYSIPRRLLGLFMNRPGFTGLLSGDGLYHLLNHELGSIAIEHCRTARLAIAAANMTREKQELLESGNLAAAIMASCAVPGMFEARNLGGDVYWDGGIADPAPFEHWVQQREIDTILVHLVLNHNDLKKMSQKGLRFREGLSGTHRIISDEIFRLKCKLARDAGKQVIVLQSLTVPSGPHRLEIGPRNVMTGRQTVRTHAELLKSLGDA